MRKLLVIAIGLIYAEIAFAANDGDLGPTSVGDADISVTIPKLIRARSFADFAFGAWTSGDLTGDDDLNISTNYGGAGRTYSVEITGSGPGGTFEMDNGFSSVFPFEVWFNDTAGTAGRVPVSPGVPLTAQANASKPLSDATLNANLSVRILDADLSAANQGGTHQSTLTVVFTPE